MIRLDGERRDTAIRMQQRENRKNEGLPDLDGLVIKKIYLNVEPVAELHGVISSPRGQYLHRRLLHALREGLPPSEIERLREEYGVEESDRHIHKLARWGLIEPVRTAEEITLYVRTILGEEALNTVRELERKIGEDRARTICEAALGVNAIRLFLTIFGSNKAPDLSAMEVIYTPLEIGQLIRVFARSVEGISSLDKLDDAGLVSYMEDGNIHVNPRRSTAFYAYLKRLHQMLVNIEGLVNQPRPPLHRR